MYSFPNLEPACCSMSSSNCCFLTCTQISQEAGKVVWYSHIFKNSPKCCGSHSQSSLLGSSVHGLLQARILEWVAFPSSGDLSNPGIKPASLMSPALLGGFFTTSTTWSSSKRLPAFLCLCPIPSSSKPPRTGHILLTYHLDHSMIISTSDSPLLPLSSTFKVPCKYIGPIRLFRIIFLF